MSFLDQLGMEHPVVQAGMGGGIADGELAGAVAAAGALGCVGILAPEEMERELNRARERAGPDRPIAANLLVPFARRGHVEVCARTGAPAVILHAGFDRALVQQLKSGGSLVVQTVGTADQAQRALADGADGLIVQGIEAGGHLFGVERAADALPRVLACAGDAPVLLAGGIADGADARRALDGGAVAVVAGTRFLLTHECPAHPEYKRRVLEADRTFETRLFGLGWPMRHRVVPNAATDRWCRGGSLGPWPILALQALSQPLARLPLKLVAGTVRTQRPSVPLFGPASALRGMPDRLVDATGLYAGETALRIDSLVTAAEAVEILAGKAAGPSTQSPTISRS